MIAASLGLGAPSPGQARAWTQVIGGGGLGHAQPRRTMRIQLTLSDGRNMSTGSRMRYACFRLTGTGGIATKHSNSAEDVVKHAKHSYNYYGFKNIAVDTVDAEIIAAFPTMDAKGQPIEIEESLTEW